MNKDEKRVRCDFPFRDGFWYPTFRDTVGFARQQLSLLRQVELRYEAGHRGLPEVYQFVVAVVGVVWLVAAPLGPPELSSSTFRWIGAVILFYFVLEVFVFSIDWVFVSPHIADERRSLATFIFSFVEVTILFSTIQVLTRCFAAANPWDVFTANLSGMFKLDLVSLASRPSCVLLSRFQIVLSAVLEVIVIAGLVGSVIPTSRSEA
jgi:hypothetical protein